MASQGKSVLRLEDSSRISPDLSYHVSSRDQTQVSRFGSDHLYPLNSFMDPTFPILSVCACARASPSMHFQGTKEAIGLFSITAHYLTVPGTWLEASKFGWPPASTPHSTGVAHMYYTPVFPCWGCECSVHACTANVLTHRTIFSAFVPPCMHKDTNGVGSKAVMGQQSQYTHTTEDSFYNCKHTHAHMRTSTNAHTHAHTCTHACIAVTPCEGFIVGFPNTCLRLILLELPDQAEPAGNLRLF